MWRALFILVIASVIPGAGRPQSANPEAGRQVVVIGVRIDAPPFAWRDPDGGGYSGFLFHLCVEAAVHAGYLPKVVPITAADRSEFFKGRRPEINLVCDPTTITISRLADLRKLPAPGPEFSPIIFVANGSYVSNLSAEAGVLPLESARSLECIPRSPATDKTVYLAAGFVGDTTAEKTLRDAQRSKNIQLQPDQRLCLVQKDTHWQAAEAFCDGQLRYYFGDEDILRSVLRMTAHRQGGCAQATTAFPLSYEPYALVVAGLPVGFRQDFTMALYTLFDLEPAEKRFQRSFSGQEMSVYLETLFRILDIPGSDLARDPDAPAAQAAQQNGLGTGGP